MIKKLTIDRARWVNGNHGHESQLLNSHGEMCCLGFLGKACGVSDDSMLSTLYPSGIPQYPKKLTSVVVSQLAALNDKPRFDSVDEESDYTDTIRESRIIKGFKQYLDIEVTFVGNYPPGGKNI